MSTAMADVRDFLSQRRIACVGLSRNPKDFSRMLFRDLCGRGYDMVPVNPAAKELESKPCFARVQEIAPPAGAALIMTSSADSAAVVRDCLEAGIRRVWLHRGGGQGAVSPEAVEFCRRNGMQLVAGECPFMFLPGTPFVHRVHGLFSKLFGHYPE